MRIYVPYAGAVLVAVLAGSRLLDAQLPLTPWFYLTWHTPITARLITWQLVTMSRSPALNTAFWSLRYEMEMSIVCPALCWLLVRLGSWKTLFLTVVLQPAVLLAHAHFPSLVSTEISIILEVADSFILGALLSWKRNEVGQLYRRTSLPIKFLFAILVFVAYFNDFSQPLIPFGACGIIIFALNSRLKLILDKPLPEYLGRVSYSLYLLHGTVLFACLILLYGRVNILVLFLIYASITFGAAHLYCILVEEPSIRMGRYLTQNSRRKRPLTLPITESPDTAT